MPQVSVIVPVFNAQQSLGRCINSILSQTFRDLELILVNDGSTDGSEQICRNWAELDPRVKIIEKPNGGVSRARNRGLEEASGEYIQFVDSDDYIAADMTEKLLAAMQFYGRETAVCSCWQITERDGETTERIKLGLHKKGSELVFDRDGLWNTMLLLVWETSSMECPWNKLYVRKIIEDNGIRFPLELSLGEDFVFNLEYFRHCNGLVFLNEPLYYYRVVENSQSLTCRARPDFLQTICCVEDALRASVEAHHELDEVERQILADHFTSRLCTGFLHLSTRCGEMMAKRQIAEIVRRDDVQEAFAAMGGAFPKYAGFPALVRRCDVGGIVAECIRITTPEPPAPVPVPPPAPGLANRALVKTMRGLQKLPVAPLRKWARIMELNLMTVGLKTTMQRVGGKLTHHKVHT